MKKILLKIPFILLILLGLHKSIKAQQVSGTGFYYDYFEYANQAALNTNWPNKLSSASTIALSSNSPITINGGSTSLASVKNTTTPNSISNTLTTGSSLNTGSVYWEWSIQYKFNSTTNLTDVTGVPMSATTKNAWKFWLFADSDNPATCRGYYITQKGTNIVLVEKNNTDQNGNTPGTLYDNVLTSSLSLVAGTTYNIKVQRINTGSQIQWRMYIAANSTEATNSNLVASNNEPRNSNIYYTGYVSSILQSVTNDNTTDNYFQWDDIKMYTRTNGVVNNNTAQSGVISSGTSLYVNEPDVVLFSFGITDRTVLKITQIDFSVTGNSNPIFNNVRLIKSTDPYYSTSADNTQIGSTLQTLDPTTSFTGLSDYVAGSPGSAGSLPAVAYYFLVVNVKTTTSSSNFQVSLNGLSSSDNNYGPLANTNGISGNTTGAVGNVYDWVGNSGVNYNWATTTNWSPTAPTGGPTSADLARIGTNYPFVSTPIVNATATAGNIIMGTASGTSSGITVNATLNVSGDITYQSDNSSANSTSYVAFLNTTGTGTVNANNLNIIASSPLSFNYTEKLTSSVTNLNLNNNISLTTSLTLFSGNPNFLHHATFVLTGGTAKVKGVLQTTNVTGTTSPTSTISVVPTGTATLQLSNTTPLSGLSSLGNNVLSFKNAGATIEYSGAAQTVYTDLAITGLTAGPSYQNIKFSGTGVKTPNGGTLNIAGDFTNSLANNTTDYLSLLTTPVIFNGTGAQSLDGGPGSGTTFKNVTFSGGGTATITANTGNFSVASTGVLTMSNNSKLVAGAPAVGGAGYLTLKSDASSSAAVAAITGTSSITGNVNVERYLSGGSTKDGTRWAYRNYRLMSSPVSALSSYSSATATYPFTFKYLANSAIVTGAIGGYAPPNTFNSATAVGNPTIYLYREDKSPSSASFTGGNFTGVTDITGTTNTGLSDGTNTKISVGNGFMFFFRGDRLTAVGTAGANKTTAPYVTVEPVTFTATGFLNQGTYTVQNWVSGGGSLKFENSPTYNGVAQDNSKVRGYNLVGNPYASSIDWDLFATSGTSGIVGVNVDPTIYVFNPLTNQYNTYMKGDGGVGKGYGGSTTSGANTVNANIIPSGQGFFVRANDHASSLTFYESAKAPTSQVASNNLLMSTGAPQATAALQYMRLVLNKDTVSNDDNLLFFRSTADTKYNAAEDAKYFSGNSPAGSLSSLSSDNVQLAINRMPLPKQNETRIISLNVSAATNGLYTFKRSDLKGIPDVYEIWLMDRYKKDSLDIKHNSTYAFNIDKADTNSFGSKRFEILIRQNPALTLKLLDFGGSKVATGTQLKWVTENEKNYTNFTIERSIDNGKTFEVIGGFRSNNSSIYTLVDKNPAIGANLYRLKQDDLDGAITYSKIVTVMYASPRNESTAAINIYPNPVSSTLSVSINNFAEVKTYNIKITNSNGIIVKSQSSAQPSWQDNVSGLLPGTYFVQVTNNETKKLIGNGKFIKE